MGRAAVAPEQRGHARCPEQQRAVPSLSHLAGTGSHVAGTSQPPTQQVSQTTYTGKRERERERERGREEDKF